MYRKIVWCYIIILTLLDISLNTKLTAQGKSHGAGISVHDSLVEGITFSEWGKDPSHGGDGGGSGARAPVRLEPAALVFGARALGAAHAATVTLHNTGNTTLHLASVAGTTPDFHASFFDSKAPRSLAWSLDAAHDVTVTLHNTGNTTLHLASVAGTTPDFHASFYDSKVSSSSHQAVGKQPTSGRRP
ncbi:hypothetical protein NE865_15293 [Phthorimaea operculella]|nr:hypothetical protein NE865_15293 [Phthorimaea operculella]